MIFNSNGFSLLTSRKLWQQSVSSSTNTVEPPYNEVRRDWQNLLAITRFRYIEVLFHIFYYYWGEEDRSLYRERRYMEVRYIEVPPYFLFLVPMKRLQQVTIVIWGFSTQNRQVFPGILYGLTPPPWTQNWTRQPFVVVSLINLFNLLSVLSYVSQKDVKMW